MSSTSRPLGLVPGAEVEPSRRDIEQALAYVEQADALVAEKLPLRGWPRKKTIDRFLADDRLEKVLSLYSRAIRLDPGEPAYPWNLAGVLTRLGLHDLALSYIERAVRVAQQVRDTEWADASAHVAWAEAALRAGQLEVALVALARAGALARPGSPAEASTRALFTEIAADSRDGNPASDLASALQVLAG